MVMCVVGEFQESEFGYYQPNKMANISSIRSDQQYLIPRQLLILLPILTTSGSCWQGSGQVGGRIPQVVCSMWESNNNSNITVLTHTANVTEIVRLCCSKKYFLFGGKCSLGCTEMQPPPSPAVPSRKTFNSEGIHRRYTMLLCKLSCPVIYIPQKFEHYKYYKIYLKDQ